MKSHPTSLDVEQVKLTTDEVLTEIGLPFKRVSAVVFREEDGTAVWSGDPGEETGTVTIYQGCDAEAIAHEIGHGFHEALNYNSKVELTFPFRYPDDGESVAEAIRFFVAEQMGSSWRPTRDTQTLDSCQYNFREFTSQVRAFVIVSLFNPRQQIWSDHFQWSAIDITRLEGISATGRATVAALQMNSRRAMQIRRWLMRIDLHPPTL